MVSLSGERGQGVSAWFLCSEMSFFTETLLDNVHKIVRLIPVTNT